MAFSSVFIEFTAVPQLDTVLNIFESNLGLNLNETFKDTRYYSGEVTLPPYDEIHLRYIGFVSTNYKNAFNADYNSSGLFTVESTFGEINTGIGTVRITANYPDAVFEMSDMNVDAIVTIDNQVSTPSFSIDEITFSTASSNACGNVKVNVLTNQLSSKIISPFQLNGNTQNPFSFDWVRGQVISLIVENETGVQAQQTITLPNALNYNNFNVIINNSPYGATVIVNNTNSNGLELQYSLDGLVWQVENVFSELPVGVFTLYVKDQLGCQFNKEYTVNEFGIQNPFFYISKSNSIRYANRVTWDNVIQKTDENTLSCESDVKVPYKEVQQFCKADYVITQFKSNFTTNTATVIKTDGTEVNVPIDKKTSNIGIKDKRTAIKYNLSNGKTGVYFTTGATYDYLSGLPIGTYALNGDLPEYAIIGNYITFEGNWFQIEDIVFDETKNANILVLSNIYTGLDTQIIVGSIYNRFEYEVYEFGIDMNVYEDEFIEVKLECTDSNFDTITYLSEQILVKETHENTIEIRYKNATNTDVYYSTDIEHIIRIPYTHVKGKYDEDSDTYKTDSKTVLLDASLYEVDDFVFEPVTKEIWRKLVIALSHETVSLNGIGYVKNGNFNTEGPLNDSNLYVLTATMIKTGNIYNSQTNGNLDFTGEEVEVPALLNTDSGFVRV
ncbi:MAG: hypothetical protein KA278_00575 [Flavobacterium sp.]|nr:hypothetical protein [Flavobacterium sp.]